MAKVNAINNKSEELTIDPGASGDSFVQFDINGTGEFRIGVDDDDSDEFKISQGSALGTNDTFTVTASGEINMPLTSAFSAELAAGRTSVTGDGTVYTVVWGSEIFDQNGDFDGTSTFTAPVTGRYQLYASALLSNIATTSFTDMYIEIETSNRTYRTGICDVGAISNNPNASNRCESVVLADMDSSDTAIVKVMVSGSTKTINVGRGGATDPRSGFRGFLAC